MIIESDKDFAELRKQITVWKKRFPMFVHDVHQIEHIIENHIQSHSKLMVLHRQTHNRSYLEKAQREIDDINRVVNTVEKIELMSMLSRG
jgi:penicillin-binding protein-related factor A (putative recombinase)